MGGLCSNCGHPQELSDGDIATLRHNLSSYKAQTQEYKSQISAIQEEIRARTVVPPGSEKHTIRFLVSRELEDLRTLLLAASPDRELPGLNADEQDVSRYKSNVERWLDLVKASLQSLFQTKLLLQESLVRHTEALQTVQRRVGREEIVAGEDLLPRLLQEYAALLEETHALATSSSETPGNFELAKQIEKEEATAEALSAQSADLNSALERLRGELTKRQQQLDLSRRWEADAREKIEVSEAELQQLKNELVQNKEKIKALGAENDDLAKRLNMTADPPSDDEMMIRIAVLHANICELEARRMELQTEVFALRGELQDNEDKITDLEGQLLQRESIEDVGEKMTSVQDKLRDIMISLESVSSEEDFSPRNRIFE